MEAEELQWTQDGESPLLPPNHEGERPPSRGKRPPPPGRSPGGPNGSHRRVGPLPHQGGPRGPEDRPHGPPPPAFIGAFTSTGSVKLTLNQPRFVSSDVKAFSHTGNVTVPAAKTFKGFFKGGSFVGNVSTATSGSKEIKVLKETIAETGGLIEGIVRVHHEHNETEPIEGQRIDLEEWIKAGDDAHRFGSVKLYE